MPYCPKCGFEYAEGTTICSDCEEELVSSPPVIPDSDEETEYKDWIQMARLTSPQYAQMLEEELRSKGIPVVIRPGVGHFGIIGTMGPTSYAPVGGGYSVMVPREFVEQADAEASALLGEIWAEARLIDVEGDDES